MKLMKIISSYRALCLIALIAFFLILPLLAGEFIVFSLFQVFIYATFGQMWNFLAENVGVISLGQQIFIGMGGYLVALASLYWSLPLFVGVLLGALVSVLIAIVLSYPLFRMRGIYFAIGSWMAASSIYAWFQNWDYVKGGFGLIIRPAYDVATGMLYYPALVLGFLSVFLTYYILRSKLGYGLRAIGDDEEVVPSIGGNTFRLKQYAFCFSAAMTALAGGIYFMFSIYVTPSSTFTINWIVKLIFVSVVGGLGFPSGPLLGSFILVAMEQLLRDWPTVYLLTQGTVILIVVLVLPQGILGTLKDKFDLEILSIEKKA